MKLILSLLLSGFSSTYASNSPAHDALAAMEPSIPKEPMKWVKKLVAEAEEVWQQIHNYEPGAPRVMIIGDSWADVVSVGGNQSFFVRKLAEHGCNISSLCLAIPGSTSSLWVKDIFLDALKFAVEAYKPDYVWMTLIGNDALQLMPDCAKQGKSEKECGDELMGTAVPNVYKIVDTIHKGHPAARVTGFGYDTMFGGLGCSLLTHDIFPQCWRNHATKEEGNRCFNTQFLRIQEGWGWIAGNRSFVDRVSIMGATQVAAGDKKASTDPNNRHIDMDAMGPAKYWPDYLACFHPGIVPQDSDDNGAMVVMEEFYKVYWSKHLTCSKPHTVVV
jgi:hypothetical protein